MGFRERMARFMYGRYGNDQLSGCYLGIAAVCFIIYLFTSFFPVYLIGAGFVIYSIYRILSKNTAKMAAQNQKFLNWRYGLAVKKNRDRQRWEQRKIYRFYKCPSCRQKVRVPKGRGKIAITCPKCRTEFIKKS